MQLPVDRFPHHEEIDTPWEPQPIAWRYDTPTMTDSLRRVFSNVIDQAADPSLTHLVREVEFSHLPGDRLEDMSRPPKDAREFLLRVGEQFAQLEATTNIKVAPTEWHVFTDPRGYTRTLARVEIIDREGRDVPSGVVLWESGNGDITLDDEGLLTIEEKQRVEELMEDLERYYASAQGQRLTDLHSLRQYVYGHPRTEAFAQKAFHLVDIEPRLENDRQTA